jgi:hypothetical protein
MRRQIIAAAAAASIMMLALPMTASVSVTPEDSAINPTSDTIGGMTYSELMAAAPIDVEFIANTWASLHNNEMLALDDNGLLYIDYSKPMTSSELADYQAFESTIDLINEGIACGALAVDTETMQLITPTNNGNAQTPNAVPYNQSPDTIIPYDQIPYGITHPRQ